MKYAIPLLDLEIGKMNLIDHQIDYILRINMGIYLLEY